MYGRCGRRPGVACAANPQSRPVWRSDKSNPRTGQTRGWAKPEDGLAPLHDLRRPGVDAAVARERLRAAEPLATGAAFGAERMHRQRQDAHRRILDPDLQQGAYEAGLAGRRCAACDPDKRLFATQLEKNRETALRRMGDPKALRPAENPFAIKVDPAAFAAMAENLSVAWTAPGVTMRVHQHLLPPAPDTARTC